MRKQTKKNKDLNNKENNEKLFPEFNWEIILNKNVLGIAAVILVIIVLISLAVIYQRESTNFTYNKVPFQKNYFGSILLYTSKLAFSDAQGNVLKTLEIDFRNDPRTLNEIPIAISKLEINGNNKTFVVDNNIKDGCEDAGIAFINLARLLSNLGLDVKGAVANKTKAIENNITFANCENNPQNMVIMLSNGEQTEVKQVSDNCYQITFKKCEILKATEKFELFVLEKIVERIPRI